LPDQGIVKYHVILKFDIDGVVDKADLIGAIFGQTEGLFGPDMNLNELQKSWKVGRIEINLSSRNGKTGGDVVIPMSTDISTASLIAAAVEGVEKVGPCQAHFKLSSIDDVRASKRKAIVDRAKTIMKQWSSKSLSEGEDVLKDVLESGRRARLITYGKEDLPAGPGVFSSDRVLIVEGRADVIVLLKAGIENVVAVEGTNIPDSIVRLGKEKKLSAFLDGDRGGDLILRELQQVVKLERVIRAPPGKEVEDLSPVEALALYRQREQPRPVKEEKVRKEEGRSKIPEQLVSKTQEIFPKIDGTLEAIILDKSMVEVNRIAVSDLVRNLESTKDAKYVVFDGIITQRLIDAAHNSGVKGIVGHRTGEIKKAPSSFIMATFHDIGLE
jgi:DNA primase